MKNLLSMLVLCLVTGPLSLAFSADASRPTLSLEIDSLSLVLAEEQIVARALDASGDPDAVLAGLAGMMDLPDISVIATNRPLSVHVFLPSARPQARPEEILQTPPQVVFVLPVTEQGKPYLSAMTELYGDSKRVNNLHRFGAEAGGGAGHSVLALGDRVVVGTDERSIRLVANKLMQTPGPATVQSVAGTIRIEIDMPILVKALEAYLPAMSRMYPAVPAKETSPDDLPEMPDMDPGKMLVTQQKMLLILLRQIRTVSIGLAARPKTLDLLVKTDYVPGTPMAGVISRLQPPPQKLLSVLPANALFASAGSGLTMVDAVNEPLAEFMKDFYSSIGPQGKALGDYMSKLITDCKGLYSGNYVMGAFPAPDGRSIGFVQLYEVNDPARARRIQEEAMKNWDTKLGTASPGLKMTLKPARTYKNAQIIAAEYSSTNATALPSGAPMPSFLKNFSTEVAFKGNYMITTLGGSQVTDSILDSLDAPGTRLDKSRVFVSVFPSMKYQPVSLWACSPLSLIKVWLGAMLPADTTQALASIPESPAGMAGFSMKNGTVETAYTRLSLDELAAIRKASEAIGNAFMQFAMSAAAGEMGRAPASPKASCINNLRLIDHAKEVVAIKNNLEDGAAVAGTDIIPYLGGALPVCPEGGKYTIGPVGQNPTCSHAGHSL